LTAPRDKGDNFANPHSLFPTFRIPNSFALATGHFLATGTFSNTKFTAYPVKSAGRQLAQARPMGQDFPLTSCRAGFFLSRTALPMH
jgi:hypothetical protein